MEERLKELMDQTLHIDIDSLTEEERAYPLLSKRYDVLPCQMLVLFTRIEQEFGIRIPDERIEDGSFICVSVYLGACGRARRQRKAVLASGKKMRVHAKSKNSNY